MKKSTLIHHVRKVESPGAIILNVLVMYEDSVTSLRAEYLMAHLPGRFEVDDTKLKTKLWRVDSLNKSILRELATVEAVAADVIIISLHGTRELSSEVCEWLNHWRNRKEDRHYALGILLDTQVMRQGKNHPVVAYLEQIAQESGADVFYSIKEPPPTAPDETSLEDIDERASYISEVIKSILRHSEPRHGKGSNE